MRMILFEDQYTPNLEPIIMTRPVFDLRFGSNTLLNRVAKICSEDIISFWVRDELLERTAEIYPDAIINKAPNEETLWLNARVLWTKKLISDLKNSSAGIFMNGNNLIGAKLSKSVAEEWLKSGGPLSFFPPEGEVHHIDDTILINYLWDLLALIPKAVEESKISNYISPKLKYVIIDESEADVFIDEDVIVEPFSYLKGPLYIGKKSIISSHSKIRNSVIGSECKIGGEVSGTIIQGNTNKVHDGFLGDSYLGEWVNLGAGTTNSNLKNNYQPVVMQVNKELVRSERQFLGSVIGDHSKTAIGTQLNTGTNIGVGCNIMAQTFSDRHIPSFTFFDQGKYQEINFNKFIQTAEIVKNRRKKSLKPCEKKLLETLFLSR
ncbi:MAG: hypothetical protein CMG57_08870 [Candidatus Marinimicrobia bacterium]|nr:hypothetical protein [Candidatus Neomarinimicrobiota bacterium]